MRHIDLVPPHTSRIRRADLDYHLDPSRRARTGGDALAELLDRTLRRVPARLSAVAGSRFPLLEALRRTDTGRRTDVARQLMYVAAVTDEVFDERWTAEYLLRHRAEWASRRRTANQLVQAARCAAYMEMQRWYKREDPAGLTVPIVRENGDGEIPHGGPSVPDTVIAFVGEALGVDLAPNLRDLLADGVCAVLALADRHAVLGGTGPSLLAMRPSARPDARLVVRLRQELPAEVAKCLARLLIGPDETGIETSPLWWVAHGVPPADVPTALARRWRQDLYRVRTAMESDDEADTYPQVRVG